MLRTRRRPRSRYLTRNRFVMILFKMLTYLQLEPLCYTVNPNFE